MNKIRIFIFPLILMLPAVSLCAPRLIEEEFNSRIFIRSLTNLGMKTQGIVTIHWSRDGEQILIDQQKQNRPYEVRLLEWEKILEEKSDAARCLTGNRDSGMSGAPNNSSPNWTADNRYVVFSGQPPFRQNLRTSGPFFGMGCDLWITDLAASRFLKLNPVYPGNAKILGATAPVFSPDGRLLLWTAITGSPLTGQYYGKRELALADLKISGSGLPRPSAEIRMLRLPGENDFIESYAFSPDGGKIYFSANLNNADGTHAPWYRMSLFSWDFRSKDSRPTALTHNSAWNRHAALSPGGRKIIWSCGSGFLQPPVGMQGQNWQRHLRSELWIMNADGKFPRQLTRFNDRNAPEYMGRRCYVGMSAWHPEGRKIAVVVNTESNNFNPESHLFILELEAGIRTPGGSVIPLHVLRAREKKHRKPTVR